MYKIGEKIVYPMHGAGTIVDIEEKEILGEVQKYYVVKIPVSEIKLMVPINSAETIGVRPIINKSKIKEIFEQIQVSDDATDSNWNKRYREHMKKIKTGDIVQVGAVVKNLIQREKEKALSTCEKRMLTSAKQILISELTLVVGESPEQVENKLEILFA